jgi:uncharacterized protein (TIGR02996 family)
MKPTTPKKSSTEAALLAAILASPADDLPRLVYADWCDENGQPERAEFIRTEIEMAKMSPDKDEPPDDRDQPRFQPLQDRAKELWDAHAEQWYPGLKRCAEEVSTDRGFPYHIATSASRFVKHAADLFAAAPTINDVMLQKLGRNAAALAKCRAFARVERLSFFETPFRRPEAEAFFTCEHLHRLKAFDIGFSDTQMGPDGAAALAACPSLVALEDLNLHNHAIFDWGALDIIDEQQFGTLRVIDFDNNGLSDEFADALSESDHISRLRVLKLGSNHLTEVGVGHLCGANLLKGLEHCELSRNPIGASAGARLAAATFAGNLRLLRVWECGLGEEGTARLLAGPFRRLEELHLSSNVIGVESARALAANPSLGSLTTLHIANCGLTHAPAAVAALADVRSLPKLESLDLGHQSLTPHAIRALVGGRLLAPVERLDLEKTQMTDAGLRAIASADLPHLKTLHVQGNRITDAGARALVKSKTLGGLESVWIQDNKLTAKGKAMVKERFGEGGCWV